MGDILIWLYPWTKSLHVIAVIAWMAAMFYLPRLYVYHAERGRGDAAMDDLFQTMERRLLKAIMNPAMIVAWLAGLALVMTPGIIDWGAVWPWTKLAGILGMSWFHGWCATQRKALLAGGGLTGRRYRIMNEVPTVLLIVIVVSVIARPF